jgi:hypothetical protein
VRASLARIEARHLARSPLLWLGVVLAAALATLELIAFWPVLAGDDLVAYRDGFVVAGGALLADGALAPLLVAGSLLVASLPGVTDRRLSVQRLSPVLSFEDRSAVYGFLPDAFWPHLGYLAGLPTLTGVLLAALPTAGGGQRPPGGRCWPARWPAWSWSG